jgi:hypothetical protein
MLTDNDGCLTALSLSVSESRDRKLLGSVFKFIEFHQFVKQSHSEFPRTFFWLCGQFVREENSQKPIYHPESHIEVYR